MPMLHNGCVCGDMLYEASKQVHLFNQLVNYNLYKVIYDALQTKLFH